MKADRSKAAFERSSGNVFRDLGFPNAEAELAKAQLVLEISTLLRRRALTQTAAAEVLGIPQPKVSQLVRGDVTGFSTDRLLRLLTLLGRDVAIVVTPAPASRATGRVRTVRRGRVPA